MNGYLADTRLGCHISLLSAALAMFCQTCSLSPPGEELIKVGDYTIEADQIEMLNEIHGIRNGTITVLPNPASAKGYYLYHESGFKELGQDDLHKLKSTIKAVDRDTNSDMTLTDDEVSGYMDGLIQKKLRQAGN